MPANFVANFLDRARNFGEAAAAERDPRQRARQRKFARHYVAAAVELSERKPN